MTSRDGTLRGVRRASWIVGLTTVALAVGLAVGGEVPALQSFAAAVLLCLVPGIGVLQTRLPIDVRGHRMELYASSAASIAVLGLVSLALGALYPGLAAMGLGRAPGSGDLVPTALLVGAGLVLVFGFRLALRVAGRGETEIVRNLLPESRAERRAFALLSVCAGLGEETAYRGFLIPVLMPLVGSAWGAAALASGTFGLIHAYQGAPGVLRSGLLGFLLAAGFVAGGSLWPPIFAHAILDLLLGLVFARWLVDDSRQAAGAVPPGS